jgi:hypothetical protein
VRAPKPTFEPASLDGSTLRTAETAAMTFLGCDVGRVRKNLLCSGRTARDARGTDLKRRRRSMPKEIG